MEQWQRRRHKGSEMCTKKSPIQQVSKVQDDSWPTSSSSSFTLLQEQPLATNTIEGDVETYLDMIIAITNSLAMEGVNQTSEICYQRSG